MVHISDTDCLWFVDDNKGFFVVDILFDALPIVCWSSVFVFVLLCITLCPC